MVWKKSSSISK